MDGSSSTVDGNGAIPATGLTILVQPDEPTLE